MNEEKVVDCLVIGAGPAGSVTAREVAKGGWSVLMVEKRPEIGVPVRCGEGISKQLLDMIGLEKDPSFISAEMDGAKIISPGGHVLTLGPEIAGPEVGFIIEREVFDQRLAKMAARAGAEIWVRAEAVSYEDAGDGVVVGIKLISGAISVKARVVVAADGFESLIARWAGIETKLDIKDIDTCLQYEMVGIETDDRYTEFFVGRRYVPGGYVWCFPKEHGIANVGLGVNGLFVNEAGDTKRYLDDFIASNPRFSKGKITEINGGGVSVSLPLEETVADHLVIVGDAARMIDPLTGGGVYNACYAALQAGKTICEALEKNDTSKAALEPYERRWRDGLEMEMARNYIAKEKLLEVSDETLDKVISAISGYDMKDITTEEILRAVGSRYPEVLKVLGGLM
ncbi:MAG: NAD(P)/FAD-dependent oxidoreductase [Candidatus Thermoplasmatota archaeon]|nr:NAD(P)/FAD-dependent oxidoreductase [Candidatus Thermoplasmatota archaeon]